MTERVHVVTGGASGLGLITVKRGLEEGWKLAALDSNTAALAKLEDHPRLLKLTVDVTDSASVQRAVAQCEQQLGPIDRVTHAAAIMPLGLICEEPRELILKVMEINFGGLVNVSKATLPGMLERRQGEFVSYASLVGHWPILYMGAYSASKHAVAAYTEVLHHEVAASGVRVVCVCPPAVATPLLKQARDTTWPRMFDFFPPISPELVIESVERGLKKKKSFMDLSRPHCHHLLPPTPLGPGPTLEGYPYRREALGQSLAELGALHQF